MKLGFVFTNYNNSRLTRAAVESIYRMPERQRCAVVVVDNASRAEDIRELRSLEADFPDVSVVYCPENRGYFGGLNVGIAQIRRAHPDITSVIVGNNDLVFPAEFYKQVLCCRELFPKYAVIAPDIVRLDGVHQNPHVVKGTSPFREVIWDLYYSDYRIALVIGAIARATRSFTKRRDQRLHRNPMPIYLAYGACVLLTPLFFAHFEALWAPTFLMGEEFFLAYQVESKGLGTYYDPRMKVMHHDHATVAQLPSRRLWEMARESHRVYRQYVTPFTAKSRNPEVSAD